MAAVPKIGRVGERDVFGAEVAPEPHPCPRGDTAVPKGIAPGPSLLPQVSRPDGAPPPEKTKKNPKNKPKTRAAEKRRLAKWFSIKQG